jgi:hypothetical protein
MPTILNPLITDAGLAAAIAANGAGLQLAITHVALGTGQYTPTNSQTLMVARKEKVTIGAGTVNAAGGFMIGVLFPSWVGIPNPYNATEIGFYAGDPDAGGILFAVFSHPSAVIVQRNPLDYVASFGLQLARVPVGSVSVTVDPAGAQSLALIAEHEAKVDPHAQYASRAQLNEIMVAAGIAPDFVTAAKLLTALRSAGVFQTPAQFDNTTKAATSAFVRSELLGLGGAAYAAVFGATRASIGYQKFPGGLILQWGTIAATTVGAATSFAMTFPTVNVCTILGNNNDTGTTAAALSLTPSGFIAKASAAAAYTYMAIGY